MKTEEREDIKLSKILAGVAILSPDLARLLEQEYKVTTYQLIVQWKAEHKEKTPKLTFSEWEMSVQAINLSLLLLKRLDAERGGKTYEEFIANLLEYWESY